MRANKKDQKPFAERKLTVYTKFRPQTYDYKAAPEIRLCGEWLRKAGFDQGESVTVSAYPDLLIIKRVE